jgi:membrane associated rhomboid family serine protease
MTMAPVGIRCPEHSGRPQGTARVTRGARRLSFEGTGAIVTKSLIALNVLVFLVNLAQGASLSQNAGEVFEDGALIAYAFNTATGEWIGVGDGEWWRMITAAFLHGSIIHLAMNMVMLWWIGAPMEAAIGRGRFLALYVVTALSGSAGALLLTEPNRFTVGASGAIFGLLGAALVFERQRTYVLGGSALSIILINLILTFAVPNISIGGHVGGLIGGVVAGLAMTRFGKAHAAYGRPGLMGGLGIAAVGLVSVAIAYVEVQQYA